MIDEFDIKVYSVPGKFRTTSRLRRRVFFGLSFFFIAASTGSLSPGRYSEPGVIQRRRSNDSAMGKIFYAVSGEGRGHAARARAAIEDLRAEHEVVLYAPGHAFELLAPVYQNSAVEVRPLPGLRFQYTASRRLGYFKTACGNLGYLRALQRLFRTLVRDIEAAQPDLAITDFEPSLPRAARRCGLPFLSLDHQHFLVTYDLRSLPFGLRCHAGLMAQAVRACHRGQVHSIVSSFYFPPLRPGVDAVTQIGVLMRPEIRHARPESGRHLVAYLRRFQEPRVYRALAECGEEVRVYGLGARSDVGRLRFREVDVRRFAEDLATCRALVTTAGNQLVGEALYLGKPVLAMPESGNREQAVNAHFLRRSGTGLVSTMDAVTPGHVRALLDGSHRLTAGIDRRRLCGNPAALAIIRRHLAPAARPVRLPIPA
jgi:uncharacterized protein (TIGR00661 family)